MIKYAFIINMPGEGPDTYCGTYENEESFNMVVGTDGMDQTKELFTKLVGEGYTLFNLCGDFDDVMTSEINALAPNVKVKHSDYFPEEMAKLEKLEKMNEYGIIVVMSGVAEPAEIVLKNPDCNTTAVFVKDMDGAKATAKKLLDDGVDFIELCSWFDKEKTVAIIDAVDGKFPVGSCGL